MWENSNMGNFSLAFSPPWGQGLCQITLYRLCSALLQCLAFNKGMNEAQYMWQKDMISQETELGCVPCVLQDIITEECGAECCCGNITGVKAGRTQRQICSCTWHCLLTYVLMIKLDLAFMGQSSICHREHEKKTCAFSGSHCHLGFSGAFFFFCICPTLPSWSIFLKLLEGISICTASLAWGEWLGDLWISPWPTASGLLWGG